MSSMTPDWPRKSSQAYVVSVIRETIIREDEPAKPTPMVYMNLVPMIDLVFNLLFFFVFSAGVGRQAYLQTVMPVDNGHGRLDPVRVWIQIIKLHPGTDESDAKYVIRDLGKSMNSYQQVYDTLEQIKRRVGSDASVILEPAPFVKYTHVANVYNQARRAGFQNVYFTCND